MQGKVKKCLLFLFVPAFLLGLGTAGSHFFNPVNKDGNPPIVIYCAAGVRAPVEMLAREYEELYGIKIELVYGSSGNLRTQIESRGAGDIYIPGDPRFLVGIDHVNSREIASHFPVLVINASRADNIKTPSDVADSNLDFVLVNPDSTALGERSAEIISALGLDHELEHRLYGRVATANQVPLYLSFGRGEAGICWFSNYLLHEEDLVIIDLPDHLHKQVPIIGVVLSSSNHPEKAGDFLHFLRSGRAKDVFLNTGYELKD